MHLKGVCQQGRPTLVSQEISRRPTSLEEIRPHFKGGEQRLKEEVDFMRSQVFTVVAINKMRKIVVFCAI